MEAVIHPDLELKIHDIQRTAALLRAINHDLRIRMLNLIHEQGPITVTDIYTKMGLEQSVASQHLAILRKARFVETERQGKCIYYKINYERFTDMEQFMNKLLS